MNTSYAIGKANVMYTLYFLTSNNVYVYVKNISKNYDKVRELYPDYDFNPNLHGRIYKLNSQKNYERDLTKFPYGKYKDTIISKCTDVNYLTYMYNCNGFNIEFMDNIKNRAIELGAIYEFGNLCAPNTEEYNFVLMVKNALNSNSNIELNMTSNLSEDGVYMNYGVWFKFNDYKVMSYAGYDYALPTINGKAKRIKNKTLVITKFYFDPNMKTINVIDFYIY